jgi:hypothetical protein
MGEILVLGQPMGFCTHEMSSPSLYFLYTEFISVSKILASFQTLQ